MIENCLILKINVKISPIAVGDVHYVLLTDFVVTR